MSSRSGEASASGCTGQTYERLEPPQDYWNPGGPWLVIPATQRVTLLATLSAISLGLGGCGGGEGGNLSTSVPPSTIAQPLPLPGPYAVGCSKLPRTLTEPLAARSECRRLKRACLPAPRAATRPSLHKSPSSGHRTLREVCGIR